MLSSNGPGPSAPDGLLGMLVGELRRAAGSISFDEQPCLEDASLVLGAFAPVSRHMRRCAAGQLSMFPVL